MLKDERWTEWFIWHVTFPIMALFSIWPIANFVIEAQHPFEEAFAGTELLLFSSLLLIGLSVHIKGDGVVSLKVGRMCAMLMLIWLGAMKYDMIKNDYMGPNGYCTKLRLYSYFNLATAAFSIALSVYSYSKSVANEQGSGVK